MLTVNREVAFPPAESITEVEFREQVGAREGAGCTEQVRATVLLKLPKAVIVTLAVAELPGLSDDAETAEVDITKS